MTNVVLESIPAVRETLIVVGSSCRKHADVLRAHFATLDYQVLPPRTRLVPLYVNDHDPSQAESQQVLKDWVASKGGEVLPGLPRPQGDFVDTGTATHQWSPSAMHRVGEHKNRILARAAQMRADAVWFCDTDLLLDRTTLLSLWYAQKPITAAVYWTHWQRPPQGPCGPQVWLQHPYGLDGRGYAAHEFRRKLIDRQLTQVWGQGACTLIRAPYLQNCSFAPVPGAPQEGMWAGEDRQFCIRAELGHIPMWADPWPDIYHMYHLPEDLTHAARYTERLSTLADDSPRSGDLVSVTLRAVEPIPVGPQQVAHLPVQFVRGRLGALRWLPEIEEAVMGLQRGETAIVKAHPGVDHPVPYFHGRRRLFEVTLVDHKPYGFAPVIEDELHVGPKSGAWIDRQALTIPQNEALAPPAITIKDNVIYGSTVSTGGISIA